MDFICEALAGDRVTPEKKPWLRELAHDTLVRAMATLAELRTQLGSTAPMVATPKPWNFYELIQRLQIAAETIRPGLLKIEIQRQSQSPLLLSAVEERHFGTALENLLYNASAYGRGDSPIRLEIREFEGKPLMIQLDVINLVKDHCESDLNGWGVGLLQVRRTLERLRGTIEIFNASDSPEFRLRLRIPVPPSSVRTDTV